ncbi:unnamed protein product [Bathycoccus prasinos]
MTVLSVPSRMEFCSNKTVTKSVSGNSPSIKILVISMWLTATFTLISKVYVYLAGGGGGVGDGGGGL